MMNFSRVKHASILFAGLLLGCVMSATAAEPARDLNELLKQVKQSQAEEAKLNREREELFMRDRSKQKQLLEEAQARLAAEEARGETLKQAFDENEKALADLEETLERRLGNLGELFGVVRQVAGDTQGVLYGSLVSAQIKDRTGALLQMSKEKKLPSIPELEELWYRLQEEMTESGKVVKFTGTVVSSDGAEHQAEITRVGVFNTVADGKFLRYLPETGQLVELPRQPAPRYRAMAANLEDTAAGMTPMAIDPSRGTILALLVQAPDLTERVQQGREIGYIIIGIAAFGLLIVVIRFVTLFFTGLKVSAQLKRAEQPSGSNPLGRVLMVYNENESVDLETLERKIDEAVLKETPKLQRGLSIIKILAVIAPLLGLLGTVTGMIQTFQSITLFGTGDPKLMAGGISQALITTVLGLMTAIPLTFFHSLVAGKSRSIIHVLEEQSAGIIARHAEKKA